MVKYNAKQLNATFSALSDPTRRAILARLSKSEATVSELAAPFGISLPAISKHLRVLECSQLITRTIEGRIHHCELNAGPLQAAQTWIKRYQRFWETQLDSLADHLEHTTNQEKTLWAPPPNMSKPRSKSNARSKRRQKKSSTHGPTRKQ